MARAYQQSQPVDYDRDHSPAEWQSLRSELVALLDQVDGQVSRSRDSSLSERMRDLRMEMSDAEQNPSSRHRDALKSVQRQINRFEEPAPQMAPNPRDTLQAAINQIRSSQSAPMRQANAAPAPQQPMQRAPEGPMLERLAQGVTGLSSRLERLEGEIKAQIKTGANVKDVADQVAQLAHVVELLAGAVGETGQVKRLEGQIASLGKIMSQGREMDISTLTRRLDDVASTVGKLAELQVHYADKVQNPVESDAFKDGMRSIETSVRNVYDRIDALERNSSLTPSDLEHVTSEMARFTETMRENGHTPHNLVELVDALNSRISDIESGDRLLHGLRKDLAALRDAVVNSMMPRFDAIDERLEALGTREDMAEIGRQIGVLSERIIDRPADNGINQLEAQVRQLVARMDQTGEQLTGLAKLYSGEPGVSPAVGGFDFDAMAEMVATRAADAVSRTAPGSSINDTMTSLESRIATMLQSMHRDNETSDFGGMQAGINEVNERLRRLESSLMARGSGEPAADMVRKSDIEAIIAEADVQMPPQPLRPRTDIMPRSPAAEAPLNAPAFPAPTMDAAAARMRHPGLNDENSLAARHEPKPAIAAPTGFDPAAVAVPPAPTPSAGFFDSASSAAIAPAAPEAAPPAASSRTTNTFIEAARRAAQRQPTPLPAAQSNSLIGRALSRFQTGDDKAEKAKPEKTKAAKPEKAPRALAGDKPARTEFKPEPAIEPAPSLEAQIRDEGTKVKAEGGESFLSRNRRTILLAAAVLAIGLMTLNLVAQRMMPEEPQAAVAAPITTGDIESEGLLPSALVPEEMAVAQGPAARVIDMVDSTSTGSIDRTAAQGFTTSPLATMPSAFEAATDLANASPGDIAPLAPEMSPIKVDLPPDGIGPIELRQAAADGNARAQFEVAAIFTEGRAVPQDYKAAATWYERSAAQGFAPAQYRLGSLYEAGNGVAKDLNTAKLWYERAAEAGNRMSMHNLAAIYAGGQLGKQQFDAAAKWFEEAANRGLTDSQFNLGMLYARGLGVPQSLEDSFKWFGIAAKSGDKDAAKARDDMARSLDADTMTRLTDIVNNFKPEQIDLATNFAPIGSWSKTFDPGETISARDIVASVQRVLGKLGYDVGTPDGIAGSKTAAAIKSFEQATGMSEVGLINPRLLAVLGSQPV
ncbi:MAG: peptidoglycan-binding protein [Devosia sp.]